MPAPRRPPTRERSPPTSQRPAAVTSNALYLITTVTGLCEAFHFAASQGLDLHQFQAILAAGPMASSVATHKLRKLVANDDSAEASIDDVLRNNRLIADEARRAGIASPLLDACLALFANAQYQGHGSRDMVAVLDAIRYSQRAI